MHYYIIFFHRKNKIDTGKKSKTMIDSEDDNSEKENNSRNDVDDVFN